MRESPLVAFYRGEGRDHRGRLLSHIHQYDFDALERHHDYIQWLFPLPEPSGANLSAPLLTLQDIETFHREEPLRAVFIRAPVLESPGPTVAVLAQLPDGRIVAAQQGNLRATAFHPELTGEDRLHRYFLEL